PANKICFSGVGDFALSHGKRSTRSVIFRVDVEDRSEPGGTNGPEPPDQYRWRIWFIDTLQHCTAATGTFCNLDSDCPSGDTCAAETVRREVACADPTTQDLASGAPMPDID